MNTLVNIPHKNHELLCLCSEIFQCGQNIKTLSNLYEKINQKVPVVSYANFRDIFTHFRKAYEAYDELTLSNQCYASKEHIQRSIKDACVILARYYLSILEQIINCPNTLSPCQEKILDDFDQLKEPNSWQIEHIDTVIHQLMYDIDVKLGYEEANAAPISLEDIDNYQNRAKVRSSTAYNTKYDYIRGELAKCFFYVMHKNKNIQELRKQMHNLKTSVHKLRSESVVLVRAYTESGNENFNNFCKSISDTYNMFVDNGLMAGIFFI